MVKILTENECNCFRRPSNRHKQSSKLAIKTDKMDKFEVKQVFEGRLQLDSSDCAPPTLNSMRLVHNSKMRIHASVNSSLLV